MTYKLLGLDDSTVFRQLLSRMFSEAGHSYIGVEGWADFASLYAENQDCDAMLIDLNLVAFTGDAVISILKKYYSNLPPVLILSGESEEKLEEAVRKSGANGYIKKQNKNYSIVEEVENFLNINTLLN